MKPLLTIIIPTYNEVSTIGKAVAEISGVMRKTTIPFEILVVDDNSPDGTGAAAIAMSKEYPVRLLTRRSNPGLSHSVIDGFEKSEADVIVVTDADLSHDITVIPKLYYSVACGFDIAIGSRYMKGGEIRDWPLIRRIISRGATFLARLLFPRITDPVSGFFAVRKSIIEGAPLKANGFKILTEILGKCRYETVVEIPYTFTNRRYGESKLRSGTIVDFAFQLLDIARTSPETNRCVKFAAVGAVGLAINSVVLFSLKEFANAPLIVASFFAIESAIISNFILNDKWTFSGFSPISIQKFAKFNLVSVGGMLINMAALVALSSLGLYYLIANFVGICCGFGWNFIVNRKVTWCES